MILSKPAKAHYTESEAAHELGVSIEELRGLIRRHIVDRDEDVSNVPQALFQPSDLVVLRLLAAGLRNAGREPDANT